MSESVSLAAAAASAEFLERAQQLADALALPCAGVIADITRTELPLLLYVTETGLQLQVTGRKAPGPVWADFVTGAVAHRRKFGGGSGQMIAKAVGIKPGVRPQVLDATAGLGKDSFVLATLGCEMTLIERSPIIHALLADGLARAADEPEVEDICARMQLQFANAVEWLKAEDRPKPQVVYLDPMFPHSEKSALVKKEMRVFRDIVGDDLDAAALLEAALQAATARVVVKRPRKAPVIDGPKPSYVLEGKSSRYDIYALAKVE